MFSATGASSLPFSSARPSLLSCWPNSLSSSFALSSSSSCSSSCSSSTSSSPSSAPESLLAPASSTSSSLSSETRFASTAALLDLLRCFWSSSSSFLPRPGAFDLTLLDVKGGCLVAAGVGGALAAFSFESLASWRRWRRDCRSLRDLAFNWLGYDLWFWCCCRTGEPCSGLSGFYVLTWGDITL